MKVNFASKPPSYINKTFSKSMVSLLPLNYTPPLTPSQKEKTLNIYNHSKHITSTKIYQRQYHFQFIKQHDMGINVTLLLPNAATLGGKGAQRKDPPDFQLS